MIDFDLARFRRLAFGRSSLPEHPLHDESEVEKIVEELPANALTGLAEVTHWVASVNAEDAFEPDARARVLIALDIPTRPYWSELAGQYLAPNGEPFEGHDGDDALLRALLDSAGAFATGYRHCLEKRDKPSRWVEKNYADLGLRLARWLGRRFVLMNMLRLPNANDVWEPLHSLYQDAEARKMFRKVVPLAPGSAATGSIKQEYVRILLLDMAELETLRGREVELVYRIAGRIAASARLEPDPIPGAICAIDPRGSSVPIAVRRLQGTRAHALYLDCFNCLPRLTAMLERGMDVDPSDPDTMFGAGFTIRERNTMVNRLIDLWGPKPPQRRSKRIALDTVALVRIGFEKSADVMQAVEQGDLNPAEASPSRLAIVLDGQQAKDKPARLKKSLEQSEVRVLDASVAGLGLLIPRKEASWVHLGTLVAVLVEPGPEWVVGAVRRISAEGEAIRVGVHVFSRKPRLVWFMLEKTGYASVWDEETRHERNFLEHFQCGILVHADHVPLSPGELLLAPGVAGRGSRLEIPFSKGVQRIRITSVRESTDSFCLAAFESMGVTPYPERAG